MDDRWLDVDQQADALCLRTILQTRVEPADRADHRFARGRIRECVRKVPLGDIAREYRSLHGESPIVLQEARAESYCFDPDRKRRRVRKLERRELHAGGFTRDPAALFQPHLAELRSDGSDLELVAAKVIAA